MSRTGFRVWRKIRTDDGIARLDVHKLPKLPAQVKNSESYHDCACEKDKHMITRMKKAGLGFRV